MATAYREIAKKALINWNGLSEEEATLKTETITELEGQVYAMDSVKYAAVGIAKKLKLTEDETTSFFEVLIEGPEDSEILKNLQEKATTFTDEQQLDVLTTIHDGWVVENSSEKTFNKKADREQLRQYAPLELIGWNEVKSDLLFLEPVLSSIGVRVDETSLEAAYHQRVAQYLETNNINSKEDLTNLVDKGTKYYPILPAELADRLLPMSEIVSDQILQNWNVKDLETAKIMQERQEKETGIHL